MIVPGLPGQNPAYRRAQPSLFRELPARPIRLIDMEEQFISTAEEDERPWAARAECRGEDPALFFPGPDDDTLAALSICARCPVRQECLEYAIEARERFGIWGGTTERQRRRMVRRSA